MSLQVEKLEKNMAKLTIEASAEEFEAAVEKAYQKAKKSISLPGFRKGKAPRRMIEKMYGTGVFYEDAANELIPDAYSKALSECEEQIVSQPKIDVVQIESGKPFIFTAEVALKPEVTLGEYKGVEVEKAPVEVTDAEIDAEVDKQREQNARTIDIDDRAVEKGDMIKLDFDGSVDGVPFDGGKAENYDLTVGSGSFIPGFEDQLVGVKIGEEVDVKVTFPEDYHAKDLAGKDAVFKCKVNEIHVKEVPEADDDFAQDISEFDTLAEYKEDIRKNLMEQKEKEAKAAKEAAVVAKVVENATMEIPDAMVDTQVRNMADDFARRIQSQGLTVDQYFQFTGMTAEKLFEQMRPDALKRIQNSLVLEAVAKAENIEISDERVEEELQKMADAYKMELDKVKSLMDDAAIDQMKDDLAIQAAVDLVRDAAKEVEAKSSINVLANISRMSALRMSVPSRTSKMRMQQVTAFADIAALSPSSTVRRAMCCRDTARAMPPLCFSKIGLLAFQHQSATGGSSPLAKAMRSCFIIKTPSATRRQALCLDITFSGLARTRFPATLSTSATMTSTVICTPSILFSQRKIALRP